MDSIAETCHRLGNLETSRRSLLAGSRLVLAAGAALALGLESRNSPAKACSVNPGPCCFLPGTQIETSAGLTAVEDLRVGDGVATSSGVQPVKWIGRREVNRPGKSWNGGGAVKIARFAIDGKAPSRDLFVSPAHAIYIDGMLIPVANLVNGKTIIANAMPEALSLTYYHVELETHEVIFAEGLAVESLLGDSATGFDNSADYVARYGHPLAKKEPFAPVAGYYGGRQELASHVRSSLSVVWDIRKPVDKVRDRLANQATLARAA